MNVLKALDREEKLDREKDSSLSWVWLDNKFWICFSVNNNLLNGIYLTRKSSN